MITALSTLRFYESRSYQFNQMRQCEGYDIHSLKTLPYQLPPFAFAMDTFNGEISGMYIADATTGSPVLILKSSLIDWAVEANVVVYPSSATGKDYVISRGYVLYDPENPTEKYELECGCYYLVIDRGDVSTNTYKTLYSEIFCVVTGTDIVAGDNLVTNGSFEQGFYGWTALAGVVAGGNYAEVTGDFDGSTCLSQSITAGMGKYKYKISFTITAIDLPDPDSAIQVSVRSTISDFVYYSVSTNGTHTFYSDTIEQFIVTPIANCHFKISGIRIERIIGLSDYVTINMNNTCRGANAVDEDWCDKVILDARILLPEYLEMLSQDENGDFQQVSTFSRVYKRYPISPLQIPEFIIDSLSKMNTFDYVSVNKGEGEPFLYVFGTESVIDNLIISTFNFTNEWQGAGCYGLVNLSFEENIGLKNSCCDDVVIDECVDFSAINTDPRVGPSIIVTRVDDTTAKVEIDNPFPPDLYVELLTTSCDDCEDEGCLFTNTGIAVTTEELNASGITFSHTEGKVCVKLRLYKPGCDGEFFSNIDSTGCIRLIVSGTNCFAESDVFGNITHVIEFNVVVNFYCDLEETASIEFYDSLTSGWIYPQAITHGGSSTVAATFTTATVPYSRITKIRAKQGSVVSNYVLAPDDPCTL